MVSTHGDLDVLPSNAQTPLFRSVLLIAASPLSCSLIYAIRTTFTFLTWAPSSQQSRLIWQFPAAPSSSRSTGTSSRRAAPRGRCLTTCLPLASCSPALTKSASARLPCGAVQTRTAYRAPRDLQLSVSLLCGAVRAGVGGLVAALLAESVHGAARRPRRRRGAEPAGGGGVVLRSRQQHRASHRPHDGEVGGVRGALEG